MLDGERLDSLHHPASPRAGSSAFLRDGRTRARDRTGGPRSNRGTDELCPSAYPAARRCSAPAAPCRWTATPRPASPPTRAPGAPATASRASTRARSPAPSWTSWTALLWGFHNSRSGCCFPSYEAIAAKAECARITVAEALKALEWAGVLTWQHRITRIRERCRDLFGHEGWRWRVIRTSNAYVFRDPQAAVSGGFASKSENRTGNTRPRDSKASTGTSRRPEQPARACPCPIRRGDRSKGWH